MALPYTTEQNVKQIVKKMSDDGEIGGTGLPPVTAEDKGKYVHVNDITGAIEYADVEALPEVGENDKNKYLHTNAETGEYELVNAPKELPEVTAEDKGKYVHVNDITGEFEYSDVPAGAMQYLAPEYNVASTYNTGDLVVHEEVLYSCKEDNVTGTWDNTKWESAIISNYLGMEVVELSGNSGTLSDEDFAKVKNGNCIIRRANDSTTPTQYAWFYSNYSNIGSNILFYRVSSDAGSNYVSTSSTYISVDLDTKYWSLYIKNGNVSANPALVGTEPELLGLRVGTTDYQMPKLSNTDNITCAYATPSDFTIADSYSSYNRCGAIITFVLAFSITKDNATTTPINIATFSNIPNTIFAKLVPTTVGLNDYLDQTELDGFSDTYANVKAPVNLTKGLTDTITLALDPTNLVVNTKYHFRYFVSFLLTDNLTKIDPILDNNSWADINTVFLSGDAANYWSVGDLKNFTGSDGVPRQQRIVDLSGLYSKHGVFEQVALDGSDGSGANGVVWNGSSNVDGDRACNNWNISWIRSYLQSTVLLRYPSDLQAILTNTTIQTATNGNNGTLVSTSDKLFLAAEKELSASSTLSRSEERAALTTWQYYQTHSNAADRVKYKNGNLTSAGYRWTRSPNSGNSSNVVGVDTYGYFADYNAYKTRRVAPAFAL